MLKRSLHALATAFTSVSHGVAYIKARLNEPSTYAGITLAVAGASALPAPWSYVSVAVGVMGVLVTGKASAQPSGDAQ